MMETGSGNVIDGKLRLSVPDKVLDDARREQNYRVAMHGLKEEARRMREAAETAGLNAALHKWPDVANTLKSGTTQWFEAKMEKWLDNLKSRAVLKSTHYSHATDRFHNFDKATKLFAAMGLHITPAEAAKAMMVKHEVRFHDMLAKRQSFTEADLDEVVDDMILYLYLIKGILIRDEL